MSLPLGFPVWIVVTHFLNVLFMTLLARSGFEILSAFPKFYLSDHCPPGRELIRFTRKVFSSESPKVWSSLDEEEAWSPVVALPGNKNLGLGRHWHFMTVQFWVVTGLVYIVLLMATGEWIRLVPTSWTILPNAMHALGTYLDGHLVAPQPGLPYNGAQQLAYFSVVFILAPLQIATGAAMSPSVIGRFPWYARLFGGKQKARLLHFLGLCAFAVFAIVHTAMVIAHWVPAEFTYAVLASDPDHASQNLALAIGLTGITVIITVNVVATVFSLSHRRRTQRLLGMIVDPFERVISRAVVSRQRHRREEISPYHRINGYPPTSFEYQELCRHEFRDYALRVGGLVDTPLTLTLEELRHLGTTCQVTKHNCIQGWTSIAEWGGVPLARILELCRPRPDARYVVFHAFDDKGVTEGEARYGHFYGSIPIHLAEKPQSILALEMNGRPLPVVHGAPARVRVETQLGFKMVKWVRAIDLVEDYASLGLGQGGYREDQLFYANAAGI